MTWKVNCRYAGLSHSGGRRCLAERLDERRALDRSWMPLTFTMCFLKAAQNRHGATAPALAGKSLPPHPNCNTPFSDAEQRGEERARLRSGQAGGGLGSPFGYFVGGGRASPYGDATRRPGSVRSPEAFVAQLPTGGEERAKKRLARTSILSARHLAESLVITGRSCGGRMILTWNLSSSRRYGEGELCPLAMGGGTE